MSMIGGDEEERMEMDSWEAGDGWPSALDACVPGVPRSISL